MDIDLHEARVPNVVETVHLTGFHDEDRARANLELLAFDHVSRPPFANEQNLIIRMAMGLWTTARFPFEEDRRHLYVTLLGSDEFTRAVAEREIVLKYSMHGCRGFRAVSSTRVAHLIRA
jgi:hypothetical protein